MTVTVCIHGNDGKGKLKYGSVSSCGSFYRRVTNTDDICTSREGNASNCSGGHEDDFSFPEEFTMLS